MDLALAQAFDSANKMDESKPIYDFWVFYYLEDGIKEYPELGVYSKAPTLTPVDLQMKKRDGLLDPTVQLLANVPIPLDGEKFKWIPCTSGKEVQNESYYMSHKSDRKSKNIDIAVSTYIEPLPKTINLLGLSLSHSS